MDKIVFQPAKRRFYLRLAVLLLLVFASLGLGSLASGGQNLPGMQVFWIFGLPMIMLVYGFYAVNARWPVLPENESEAPLPVQDGVKLARQIGASIYRVNFEDSSAISLSRGNLSLPKTALAESDPAKFRAGLTLAVVNSRFNLADRALEMGVLTGSVLANVTRDLLLGIADPARFWISGAVASLAFIVPIVISIRLKPRMIARAVRITGEEAAMERYLAETDSKPGKLIGGEVS